MPRGTLARQYRTRSAARMSGAKNERQAMSDKAGKRVTMHVPRDARDASSACVTVSFERVPRTFTLAQAARGNPATHAFDSRGESFCSRGASGVIRAADWKGETKKGKASGGIVTCVWCELRMIASGTLAADKAVTLLGKACGKRVANGGKPRAKQADKASAAKPSGAKPRGKRAAKPSGDTAPIVADAAARTAARAAKQADNAAAIAAVADKAGA